MSYPVEFFETIDNAVPRFDGVEGRLQGSGVIITDSDDLIIPGHIYLGGNTSFRVDLVTGNTASSLGGSIAYAHGLDANNIISMSLLVNNGTVRVTADNTSTAGNQCSIEFDSSDIRIINHPFNSYNILNKAFKAFLFYSE